MLDVLHASRLALRIYDGAFSAMDLTARHPRTGELLSAVKFMVQTLAAAGGLQRDLQRELTYDGRRAAEAKGNRGGRRPAVTAAKAAAVRAGYLGRQPIAGLARDHHVSRGAIRTAVDDDLLPDHTTIKEDVPAPELPVTLDMPGKVADFLRAAELEPAERDALGQGVTVRRGQGYTLRVSAVPSVHGAPLARCRPLDAPSAIPARRKPAASTPTAPVPSGPGPRSKPSGYGGHHPHRRSQPERRSCTRCRTPGCLTAGSATAGRSRGPRSRTGVALQRIPEPEESLELRMLHEPAQEHSDEPVVTHTHRAHDARYDPAIIAPGGFIPFRHLPVVAPRDSYHEGVRSNG